jgi:hypothetical protein
MFNVESNCHIDVSLTNVFHRSSPEGRYHAAGGFVKPPRFVISLTSQDDLRRVNVTEDAKSFQSIIEEPHCGSIKKLASVFTVPSFEFVNSDLFHIVMLVY